MEHGEAWDKLDEWLDGELPDASAAELSRHLDACPACKAEAGLRRRLGEALFAPAVAQDPRSSAAFARRVMARVEADSVPLWQRLFAPALTPALALGLAALVLSIVAPGLGYSEPFDGWDEPDASYAALVEVP
ncbi:MAG: zf-HC2 domain-containing protein [Elusimicrobiota bacterium]|nr:zf-HC2 domain-containing protein [Elusimicrobiota bacterium]